jgi:predicted Rossmann fold nucleotide-binding protein DprA/Smf involved in DNA uptake
MTVPPRPFADVLRDEMVMHEPILAVLGEGPKTIAEIAAALGKPSREVMLWVMGMLRQGVVKELPKPKADDYFRYTAAG